MKVDRRDWLIGAGGLIAASAAFGIAPRAHLDLMGGRRLDRELPRRIGAWSEDPGQGVIMPPSKGSLVDQLYQQLFSRAYVRPHAPDGSPVMLFSSYGARQSDALQLHRPEACYPSIGFTQTYRRLVDLPVGNGVRLPVVTLTMAYGERYEDLLYWARIGDALPQDSIDQRLTRMEEALRGTVLDGLLMRLSGVRLAHQPPLHGMLADFVREMLAAVDPAFLPALIGRTYARGLAR